MQVNNVAREIMKRDGRSMRAISAACGRAPEWARVVSQPTRSPALATVVEIADACGYDVAIISRETGETLGVVEPPKR